MRDEENEMTMIERVAKTLSEKLWDIGCGDDSDCCGYEDMAERTKEIYRKAARAAIEAMREPTDEMVDSAYTCDPEDGVYVEYQAMIDEALSE